MTTKFYDGYLLAGILLGDDPAMQVVKERLALSLDNRIPRSAIGYIDDLCNEHSTRAVKMDRLRQLSKFVKIVMPN